MTPNPKPAPESGERYLLVKRGLYYRPDNRGYTGIKDHAGRYLASDASPDCGVTAIHEDQAPEYSEACYPDVMAEHLAKKIASLTSELATVKKRLESAEEELEEARDSFNYLCKWVERGLFDQHVTPEEALKCIAHHPDMPWMGGRWDVDHKPYREAFYKAFPKALQEQEKQNG